MKRKSLYLVLAGFIALVIYSFIPLSRPNHSENRVTGIRARGYALRGDLKTTFWNNGLLTGSNFSNDPSPEGFYGDYQYVPAFSFVLGIPGRDPQGNPYPWAMRPAVDSLTGQVYPDSIIYWGPTVSESWFDRTSGMQLTDWEAVELSDILLFGNATNRKIAFNYQFNWFAPKYESPVLAHSRYPFTWPGGANRFWPGFWGWDENGQVTPGLFFSDEDIYWEMDDRWAIRDVDPTQGYPSGIKVKAMTSGFKNIPGGFVLYRLRLINQSPWNYKDIYSGFYFDADIFHRQANGNLSGRTNDDDMMQYSWGNNLSYIWDLDDNSGGFTGLDYAGIGTIETPPASREIDLDADGQPDVFPGQPTGITGWHWFDWYFRPGAYDAGPQGPYSGDGFWRVAPDKEAIQFKLMAGDTSTIDMDSARIGYNLTHYFHPAPGGFLNPRFDSNSSLLQQYPNGLDCVFLMSNGPFNLDSGDSVEVVAAMVAAPDSSTLKRSFLTAHRLYEHKYPYQKIQMNNGNGGEIFSGNDATLTWQVDPSYPHPVSTVDIWLGKGFDSHWITLATEVNNTGSYTFNTADVEDGAFYKAAIVSHQGPGFVYGVSDSFFTINNPGQQVAPEIVVTNPQYHDTLSGIATLQWIGRDADSDSTQISIYAIQNGFSTQIMSNQWNIDSYEFQTAQLFNGEVTLRFTLQDLQGVSVQQDISPLYVQNAVTSLLDTVFHHVSGQGNGVVSLSVVNSTLLNGHQYQISFDSTSQHAASVYDRTSGSYVAQNIEYIGNMGTAVFDGLKLGLTGFDPPVIDSTYWKMGNSDWQLSVSMIYSNTADYELVFDTLGVDSAESLLSGAMIALPFQVYNRTFTPQTALRTWILDLQGVNEFSSGDVIILRDSIVYGEPSTPVNEKTFKVTFTWDSTSIPPQPGDIFRFTTLGYFWEPDTILFKSPTWMGIAEEPLPVKQFTLYPNYPNPFNPSTTIRFTLPQQAKVKLEIFNILGQRVRTLVDEKKLSGNYRVTWDGRNSSGQQVASGVYLYRLSSSPLQKESKHGSGGLRRGHVKTRKMLYLK